MFRRRQIFAKNGEFDKRLSNVWQKLINELTKRKHVKIWVPEKYLKFDVTLLSRKNNLKAFLLSLRKMYPLTEILPSMHRDGIN